MISKNISFKQFSLHNMAAIKKAHRMAMQLKNQIGHTSDKSLGDVISIPDDDEPKVCLYLYIFFNC